MQEGGSVRDMASSFLKAHLDDDGADFSYKSGYSSELVHHAYFRQAHVCLGYLDLADLLLIIKSRKEYHLRMQ